MKDSIEKNIVPISISTLITIILSVIGIARQVSSYSANYDVRIALLEQDSKTQQNYNYQMKKELKDEMKDTNKKLGDIYNLLLKQK